MHKENMFWESLYPNKNSQSDVRFNFRSGWIVSGLILGQVRLYLVITIGFDPTFFINFELDTSQFQIKSIFNKSRNE